SPLKLLELVLILPSPREIRLDHEIQHEIHSLDAERGPAVRALEVNVPTEVIAVRQPRHPHGVPKTGPKNPQRRYVPRVTDVIPVSKFEILDDATMRSLGRKPARVALSTDRVRTWRRNLSTSADRQPQQQTGIGVLDNNQRSS